MKPKLIVALVVTIFLFVFCTTFQIIDLPELFKDSRKEVQSLNESIRESAEIRQSAYDIQNAHVNAQYRERIERLNNRVAEIDEEQAVIKADKERLKDQLDANRAELARINELLGE